MESDEHQPTLTPNFALMMLAFHLLREMTAKEYCNIADASELFGISDKEILQLAAEGKIGLYFFSAYRNCDCPIISPSDISTNCESERVPYKQHIKEWDGKITERDEGILSIPEIQRAMLMHNHCGVTPGPYRLSLTDVQFLHFNGKVICRAICWPECDEFPPIDTIVTADIVCIKKSEIEKLFAVNEPSKYPPLLAIACRCREKVFGIGNDSTNESERLTTRQRCKKWLTSKACKKISSDRHIGLSDRDIDTIATMVDPAPRKKIKGTEADKLYFEELEQAINIWRCLKADPGPDYDISTLKKHLLSFAQKNKVSTARIKRIERVLAPR